MRSTLEQPCRLLIWRQDVTPMFRELGIEEAMMWDEAASGHAVRRALLDAGDL